MVSDGLGKVWDCLGKVSKGLGKVSDCPGKVLDGLGKVSDSLGKLFNCLWKVLDVTMQCIKLKQVQESRYKKRSGGGRGNMALFELRLAHVSTKI